MIAIVASGNSTAYDDAKSHDGADFTDSVRYVAGETMPRDIVGHMFPLGVG